MSVRDLRKRLSELEDAGYGDLEVEAEGCACGRGIDEAYVAWAVPSEDSNQQVVRLAG